MKRQTIISILSALSLNLLSHSVLAATEVRAPIETLSYDQESFILSTQGHLPNGCAASPVPVLNLSEGGNALELSIVAQQESEICIGSIGGSYTLVFDVRSLKGRLVELNLNPNATYELTTPANDFAVTVNFATESLNSTSL